MRVCLLKLTPGVGAREQSTRGAWETKYREPCELLHVALEYISLFFILLLPGKKTDTCIRCGMHHLLAVSLLWLGVFFLFASGIGMVGDFPSLGCNPHFISWLTKRVLENPCLKYISCPFLGWAHFGVTFSLVPESGHQECPDIYWCGFQFTLGWWFLRAAGVEGLTSSRKPQGEGSSLQEGTVQSADHQVMKYTRKSHGSVFIEAWFIPRTDCIFTPIHKTTATGVRQCKEPLTHVSRFEWN